MLSSSSSSSKIPKRREYMVFTRHPLVGFLVLLLVARTSLASSVDALEQNARHLALDHVTCNKDEILLEIGAVTGDSIKYDWQVIDERTGEMFSSCKPSKNNNNAGVSSNHCYWTGKTMIYDRTCVPMDGCYRLVIGELHRPSGTDDNNIVEVSYPLLAKRQHRNTPYFSFVRGRTHEFMICIGISFCVLYFFLFL